MATPDIPATLAQPSEEEAALQRQLEIQDAAVSFFSLFRYATAFDLFLLAISSACAIVAGSMRALSPVVFGKVSQIFAEYADGHSSYSDSKQQINHYTPYFLYVALIALTSWFIASAGCVHLAAKLTRALKTHYLSSVLRQNIALFDDNGTGNVISQLTTDANAVQEGLAQKLAITISSMGTLIATLVVTFTLNWQIALMLSWAFLAGVGVIYGGHEIAVRYGGSASEAYSFGSSVAEEAFGSIRTTTALGIQEEVRNGYMKHIKVAERSGFILKASINSMQALAVGTGFLNVALAFWQGARYLTDGRITLLQVIAMTFVTKSAAFCVIRVAQNAEVHTSGVAAARRMFQIIHRESPIDPFSTNGIVPTHVDGTLEFDKVRHIYPKRPGVVVLDDLTIAFPKHKTTAIVGPSGSGKSSVAHLLLRFYDPLKGQVRLDGRDLKEYNLNWLRQHITIVSQEPFLFDTSIFANIAFGLIGTAFENFTATEKREYVEDAARLACAHDFITALPQGYETTVGPRGSKLSGGQRQRIAIARALVRSPEILILDEATSALDVDTEARIQANIAKSKGNTTRIVIAHRLSTIRDADKIIALRDGKLLEQGSHQELMETKGTYYDLVQAQDATREDSDNSGEIGMSSEDEDEVSIEDWQSVSSRTKLLGSRRGSEAAEVHSLPPHPGLDDSTASFSLFSLIKLTANLNRPELPLAFMGCIFCILAAFEEPVFALLFGRAIGAMSSPGVPDSQIRSDTAFYSWMFLVLAVSMVVAFAGEGVIFSFCSERLIRRARALALWKILRQDVSFFDYKDHSPGALASFLATETKDLAGMSGVTLGIILLSIFTLIIGIGGAFAFGWKLALVSSAAIPALLACGFCAIYLVGVFEQQNGKFARESASYASEAVSAIRTVAALTRESQVIQDFQDSLNATSKAQLLLNLRTSFLYGLTQSGFYAAMALGFWYGGKLILRREYSLEQFTVVYTAIAMSAYSAGFVFAFTPDIGKAAKSAAALNKLLARESQIDPLAADGLDAEGLRGEITFKDVSFSYPTRPQRKALDHVSFSIKPGSHVAFVGATGAGKSTIISLLERFYDADHGRIFIDSQPITSFNVSKLRKRIGLVEQEPVLYNGTIKSNLLAGLSEEDVPDPQIIEACKKASIWSFFVSLPQGLSTPVGARGTQLSGGQKQRLALARAFIRNPVILLLDEATSAIDSQSEVLIREALVEAMKGRTTITIAHRLSTVRNADWIYVMDKGRIAEQGRHEELLARKGRYFGLWMKSLGGQVL